MKFNNKKVSKGESQSTAWMVQKSMRDLTARSISVAATPNQVARAGANPYPMLAQQNKIIDTNYAGDGNLTGNVPIEINNNPQSAYLHSVDLAHIRMGLRYNYMAILPTDKNVAVNVEYNKAMVEALANAYAETFTDLPFFNYKITTDMPGCGDSDTDQKRILAFATFYQTVAQNIAHVPISFNNMLSMEQVMYDQSWLRETPQLKQLMGLMKKKTLKANVEAIANYIPGLALDTSWLTQTNILCNVPCKRSDSYDDPLITVGSYTVVPDITVYTGSADDPVTIFKYSETDADNDYQVDVNGTTYTLTDLVSAITESMDPYSIMVWARQAYEGRTAVTARDYFNGLVDMLEGLVTLLARFPQDVADFDVVLKVMQRANLNNWQFHTIMHVDDPGRDYKPVFNKLLYDIIAARSCGGADMIFDTNTRRWKFFTLWDRVTDIPDYDLKSGGSFLAFSLRTLPNALDHTGTQWLIPILFTLDADGTGSSVEICDRMGYVTSLDYDTLDYSAMRADAVLARLVPLPSMSDARIRIPKINVTTSGSDELIMAASYAIKFVMKLCGIGEVIYDENDYHIGMNDTVMNLVDEQLEDVSNAMINQARVSSPFRVAVGEDVRTIGFVKVVQ